MSDSSAKAKEENNGQSRGRSKKVTSKKTSQASEPSLNMDELYELASLVDEHGFTDFEFENANIRVRLSKNPAPQIIQAQPYAAAPVSAAVSTVQSKSEINSDESPSAAESEDSLYKITSPIVGTFYSAPAPDKDSYVKEGTKVTAETTVCIVEAMKLMNEIQAEVSGEVVKIYVENGQPVEYGQPLFGIKQ